MQSECRNRSSLVKVMFAKYWFYFCEILCTNHHRIIWITPSRVIKYSRDSLTEFQNRRLKFFVNTCEVESITDNFTLLVRNYYY